ncbi:MAG: hypothetical protein ACK47B_05110 [Armatimonadota bacterium]
MRPTGARTLWIATLALLLAYGAPGRAQDSAAGACRERLAAIGKAVTAYEREHGSIPESFTRLFPKHLTDRSLLICPSDEQPRALRDGDLPASYHSWWNDNPDGSGMRLSPPRAGATQREVLTAQRQNFGDHVPVTACWRHRLLLAVSGEVRPTGRFWQQDLVVFPTVVASLHRDALGEKAAFDRRWDLAALGKYLKWALEAEVRLDGEGRTRLREAAAAIRDRAGAPEGVRSFTAGMAFAVAGETDPAFDALERSVLASDSQHERALEPLDALYRSAAQPERAIRFYRRLLDRYPGGTGYAAKLADAYQAAGRREEAREWSARAAAAAEAVTRPASVEACRLRLQAVHRALTAYRTDRGELPANLSDLAADHLKPELLHCPSDHSPGSLGTPFAYRDPAGYVSYAYEMSLAPSGGMPHPLGPFPRRPDGWGSRRDVATHQGTFYGPQVPVVRCFHHRPAARESNADDQVLNLRADGSVYRSGFRWESHPESVRIAMEGAARDLDAGPEVFSRRWYLGQIDQDASDWIEEPQPPETRAALVRLAKALETRAKQLKPLSKAFALRVAGRLYRAGGEHAAAICAGKQALGLLPESDPGGRSAAKELLAAAYRSAEQYDPAIVLYRELHEASPRIGYYMVQLAELHELAGRPEDARAWRQKADPGQRLVGQPAPDFTVATPGGEQLALSHVRRGGKATLINFWFYG